MKRVIKNQKKMKNTMYIVFGVFALALFGITMLNPSYAEEGLIIDDALDAMMQGTEMYGSGGFEKVEEEKLIQPVEDNESEDVVEPELAPDERLAEGDEIPQNLDDVNLEGDDDENGEENEEIANDENEEHEISENLDETVLERNGKGIDKTENKEESQVNEKFHGVGDENMDNEKGKDKQEENYDVLDFYQPKSESKIILSSEDNPYIVHDEDKGLITIYTGDFSYGITIQDKNLGADKVGDFGNYYKGGYNIPIVIEDMDDTIYGDENSWGGGGDNSDNNYGYDKINHTVTNASGRQGPCPEGYHVPSRGEWIELNNIYDIIKSSDGVFYEDLELPLAGYVHISWGKIQWLGSDGSYHSSSYFYDNHYFKTQFGTDYYGGIYFDAGSDTHIGQHGESVRCFKNVYEQYRNPVDITYHPNGGSFSGMNKDETSTFTYYYAGEKLKPVYNIQIPNKVSEDISQQSGWMFAGWYTTATNQTEEFDPNTSTTKTAYAKWLPFNDLDISIGNIEFTLMDRNLGAEDIASGTYYGYNVGHEDNSKLGYYYQRGNNYGFNYFSGIQSTEKLVSAKNYGPNNYYYNNKFILTPNNSILDRSSIRNPNLWGGNNLVNTDYDKKGPCPEGYHIPEAKEWNAIYNIFTTNTLSECYGKTVRLGECIASNLKLPYAGDISGVIGSNSPEIYFAGEEGYYWSSSPDSLSTRSKFFYMTTHSIEPMAVRLGFTNGRNSGFSVRCMKNDSHHNNLKFMVDNQEYSSKELLRWEPVVEGLQPDNPTKENATFIGWKKENSNDLFEFGDESYIFENTNLSAEFSCNVGYTKSSDGLNCEKIGLTFNANGGLFSGDITEKKIDSSLREIPAIQKISHTINYKDNGDFIEEYQGEPVSPSGIVGFFGTDKVLYYKAQENITDVIGFDDYGEKDQFEINLKYGYAFGYYCTKIALWTGDHPDYTYSNNLDTALFSNDVNYINTVFETGFDIDSNNVTISFYNTCPSLGYYLTFSKKKRYEVIYDLDEINKIENPIYSGYKFLGRYESGAVQPFDFTGTEITQNKTLYAKREAKPYTITFDTDGGSKIDSIIVNCGEKISVPTPTKECNAFSGWDTELPETMPAHDITLKAIWNYTCSRSSGAGGKKSDTTTRDIAIDTNTENEHNSADEKDNVEKAEENKTVTNNETSNQVISVTQETSEDGMVEAIIETVKIKNTDIVATVRTEVDLSSSSSSTTHTKEQNDAYSFAKSNGITSTSTIKTAKMDTDLTRIQMAKMVSNYAINVLGQEPDVEKGVPDFKDVTAKMDKQYDNAVTKAYQLGIMGQNVENNKFRPNDEVSRAEFSATLSRLLYNTDEGKYKGTGKYYIPHIVKLYNEGIINKMNPVLKEKRGYVMTMLMRTVK